MKEPAAYNHHVTPVNWPQKKACSTQPSCHTGYHNDTLVHWLKDPAAYRAVNPSGDLSVAKSDFKRSNLILSVAYMVLHQDFLKTCCLASPAAERVMLCKTTKKCEKCPHSNYVQML